MTEFEMWYEKAKKLPEWPPKDEYDLYYSHKMAWNAAQSGTPAEDRYGREPDKVKPLAQYLGEYIEYEMIDNTDCDTWVALLEQALDAYESTECVKIRIERDLL